jgi:hypothetical protein
VRSREEVGWERRKRVIEKQGRSDVRTQKRMSKNERGKEMGEKGERGDERTKGRLLLR